MICNRIGIFILFMLVALHMRCKKPLRKGGKRVIKIILGENNPQSPFVKGGLKRNNLKGKFPMEKIYMDNASGSPVHPKVVEAMMPFLRRIWQPL